MPENHWHSLKTEVVPQFEEEGDIYVPRYKGNQDVAIQNISDTSTMGNSIFEVKNEPENKF